MKISTNYNRSYGEWRLLIFDGFESHLNVELIEFSLQKKILPFCLPAHTSHVLQPLDVGVFSAMQKYYSQEVLNLRVAIDKSKFPEIFAKAHEKAFTASNIAAGFRRTGISPYEPTQVLFNIPLPDPKVNERENHPPPTPPPVRSTHQLLTHHIIVPTTPRSIHNYYVECLSTILSSSPRSRFQRALFTGFKMSAEKCAAKAALHEAGEEYLREQIKQHIEKAKPDKRRLNTNEACVIENVDVLVQLKRKRNELDTQKAGKRARSSQAGSSLEV